MSTIAANVNALNFQRYTPVYKNQVSFQPSFSGIASDTVSFSGVKDKENFEELNKSKVLSLAACLWSKTTKKSDFLLNGHISELKDLQKDGTVIIYAPKHYDTKDVPSLIKLFDSMTSDVKEFQETFPFFMRKKYKDKRSLKDKILLKIKDNMGAFSVDTDGNGSGRKALATALKVVESKNPFMIFPEGEFGLKYAGQPISEEKQELQPIKKGLSFIVQRLISAKQKDKYPENFKVVVVPIGISGEAGGRGPSSVYVGKPIDVFATLPAKIESAKLLNDKLNILTHEFQSAMQEAQNSAYKEYNLAQTKIPKAC
ncbi:MAG: 1-acyl-sn-glycerol-3-phosphate acyltransferase [Vampirovibrionia bacterium]